jgi:ABC-type multidrug transport system ATPase subunit
VLCGGIAVDHDPILISVCPQFNCHLCYEMTPREHLYLYPLLRQFEIPCAEELENRLLVALKLVKYADKPVRELGGGNQRKLVVALSFFAWSNIILLNEPTSSLDAVA